MTEVLAIVVVHRLKVTLSFTDFQGIASVFYQARVRELGVE